MDLLYLVGEIKCLESCVILLCLCSFLHPGVHGLELMGFTTDRLLKIFLCRFDAFQNAKMVMGMDGFGFSGRPEKFGHLGVSLLICLLSESEVFSIGLRFPGECLFEIFF